MYRAISDHAEVDPVYRADDPAENRYPGHEIDHGRVSRNPERGLVSGVVTAGFSEHDPHCMMHVCDLDERFA